MSWFDYLKQLRGNTKFVRTIRVIGFGLTAVAIVLAVRQGSNQITVGNWKNFADAWAISIGTYVIAFGFQALAWCSLIGGLGRFKVGWKDLEIFAISHIVRRTPGAVWYLFERIERYGKQGMNVQTTLAASGIEWLLLVLAGALVYFLVSLNLMGLFLQLSLGVAFFLFLFFSYIVVKRRVSFTSAPLNPNVDSSKIGRIISAGPEILFTLLIDALSHGLCGIIIYQLVQSSTASSVFSLSDGVLVWTLTSVIGIISSVVIPVNLGLRELTISTVLLRYITLDPAITVAAEVRLILILADTICGFGLWYLARWILARKENGSEAGSAQLVMKK